MERTDGHMRGRKETHVSWAESDFSGKIFLSVKQITESKELLSSQTQWSLCAESNNKITVVTEPLWGKFSQKLKFEDESWLHFQEHLSDSTEKNKLSTYTNCLLSISKTHSTVNKQPARTKLLQMQPIFLLVCKNWWKKTPKMSLQSQIAGLTKTQKRKHSTKLATSSPLVLTLCSNLLTLANPGLTLHRNEQRILVEWVYPGIVLTGAFFSPGLKLKKENAGDKNKVLACWPAHSGEGVRSDPRGR